MPRILQDSAMTTVLTVVDVLAVAVLLYNFILVLRGRRAMAVLSGMTVLVIIYLAAVWLRLRLLEAVLAGLAPYTIIAFIVMFQSELRAYLTRIGRIRWVRGGCRPRLRNNPSFRQSGNTPSVPPAPRSGPARPPPGP